MWLGLKALANLDAIVDESFAQQSYKRSGTLRPAATHQQAASFKQVAKVYPTFATWITKEKSAAEYPDVLAPYGLLFLHCGGIVDTPRLINCVLSSASDNGSDILFGQSVIHWGEKDNYAFVLTQHGHSFTASRVLLCLGSGYRKFPQLSNLNFQNIKGQVVVVPKPTGLTLTRPVSGNGYVVPGKDTLIVGTTYERGFDSEEPTEEATRLIMDKAVKMIPCLQGLTPFQARAGIRVGVPGTRLPIVGPLSDRIWIFTGLGSKGILFSSLLSRWIPAFLKDPTLIPADLRIKYQKFNPS